MKKKLLFIGLTCIAIICAANCSTLLASSSDSWTAEAPLPYVRGTSEAADFNGSIYLIGWYNTFYVYDPNVDVWVQKASVPVPGNASLNFEMVTACDGKIFAMGIAYINGMSNTINVNAAYDPTTDSWTLRKTPSAALRDCTIQTVDDKIYLIDGLDPNIYVYDPVQDNWSQAPSISMPVYGCATVAFNHLLYVIGGENWSEHLFGGQYTCTNLVQIFDPSTNQWTQGTPMPKPMESLAAAATTGTFAPRCIYVAGGVEEVSSRIHDRVNLMQIYNPITGSWGNVTPMPDIISDLCLVSVNDKLYALGGINGAGVLLKTNYQYSPANWSEPTPTQPSSLTPTPTPTESPSPAISPTPVASPSVPEFLTWTALPLILVVSVVVAVATKRIKLRRQSFS